VIVGSYRPALVDIGASIVQSFVLGSDGDDFGPAINRAIQSSTSGVVIIPALPAGDIDSGDVTALHRHRARVYPTKQRYLVIDPRNLKTQAI
jgi:hypothetical protein